MKLQTIIEQGYRVTGWAVKPDRGDRRMVIKLDKKTTNGIRFYVVHSPQTNVKLVDMEFTEPTMVAGVH